MESRTLYMKVMYATDLENVRHIKFKKMNVYVVISISGDSSQPEQITPVDKHGGTDPTWNHLMQFTINESAAQQNRLTLVFQLMCERSLGDKDIGAVQVPMKELLDGNIGASKEVRRGVVTPSGTIQGELKFSYSFGAINDDANPAPPPFGVNPTSQPRPVRRVRQGILAAAKALVTCLGAAYDKATNSRIVGKMQSGESRPLEINLISAKGLKDGRSIKWRKMQVYAVVSISGGSKQTAKRTDVDRRGGNNPNWNPSFQFTFNKSEAKENLLTLVIELRCKGFFSSDKNLGSVSVPFREILGVRTFKEVHLPVQKNSTAGTDRGELKFSYRNPKRRDPLQVVNDAMPSIATHVGLHVGLALCGL